MTGGAWLSAVRIVHALPGRVRFRYASAADSLRNPGHFERTAGDLAGVRGVRVNRAARSVIIAFDPTLTDVGGLCRRIAALPAPLPGSLPAPPKDGDKTRLLTSLGVLLGSPFLPPAVRLPIILLMTAPLLKRAAEDYAQRGVTSHALEGMAVGISLARGDHTAANTTGFMLELGEYLEDSIARRSDELLKHLLRPANDEIWVMRDGVETRIPAEDVVSGETVIAATGTVIPVDGTILSGEATVNEATMTGESVSAIKTRGDPVLSGTLIEEGRLLIYAEQTGRHTAAARIAEYIEQALVTKSEAQVEAAHLADRLVPHVLRLAGAAFLLSGDWRRTAAVLQADYSCALKLATPVAFKAAMYAAGRAGVLVKGAAALERLAQADTIIFDKTGTLTTGQMAVTDVFTFDTAYTPDDLLCLAASVEEHYFHPLALAVVAAARATHNRHFDHQEVKFIVAHGVASVIDGQRIVVGSRHFVQEDEGIDVSAHAGTIERLYSEGKTLLYIGYGGRLVGLVALKDTLREASARTVRRLRQLGVRKVLILTGDHHDRASELAAAVGADDYHAELLPEDKARIVGELAAAGHRIAFVGDGINDAPALAGASVGIAMQKGADIARLTADVALLNDDVELVAEAKAMANGVMARIDTNYRLTVGLNTAILGSAALGLLSLVGTSVLHNGTTIGILLNAMRGVSPLRHSTRHS